jgi:glycerol-3-phosphate dehydrogenase
LPQADGLVYLGITDEPVDAVPDGDPVPTDVEVKALLGAFDGVLARPLRSDDVIGSFAGLRPLLSASASNVDGTADLSRRHVVHRGDDGVVTVVGGKLTTYRRMAADALDAAVDAAGLRAGRCVTARLPLVGAASRRRLAQLPAPARLVARYGTEGPRVLAAGSQTAVAPGLAVTAAEFAFAVRHEGALDAADLLDRRTRIGLVPADRAAALTTAEEVIHRTR